MALVGKVALKRQGYGFIKSAQSRELIFFLAAVVDREDGAEFAALNIDDHVEFDMVDTARGPRATRVFAPRADDD
jgi:cold shock CspA family protein